MRVVISDFDLVRWHSGPDEYDLTAVLVAHGIDPTQPIRCTRDPVRLVSVFEQPD